jgi:hypothetical protein
MTRTNCMFRLHEGSIKKEEIVDFLKAIKAHLKQPLLVIWDGLKAHRSHLVRDYLDTLNGHIQVNCFCSRQYLTSASMCASRTFTFLPFAGSVLVRLVS